MIKSKSQVVRDLRAAHPNLPLSNIARKAGVTDSTARQALSHSGVKTAAAGKEPGASFEVTENTATASTLLTHVKTLDDLLAYHAVDLAIWEVERHVINKWDMGAVIDGKPITTPLFQVKAWLRRKTLKATDTLAELVQELKEAAPAHKPFCRPTRECRDDLLELSLFDLHFGKLCWGAEVGQSYDLKIAQETLNTAVEALVARASGNHIGRILLPVGNDFFNVDNKHNMTSSGTPQDCDSRWQRSFIKGRRAMVDVIDRLRSVAPVDVVMVSGNHDTERVFYLGEVLSAHFSKTPDVTVDNSPKLRKYFVWGDCFLGFTHGDKEKHQNLPLIMATEMPTEWGRTKYREVHVGHFHKKKEIFSQAIDEHRGVRVRVIPSLCPPDAWHYAHGYEALRAAEAFVWNKSQGCVAQFSYQP